MNSTKYLQTDGRWGNLVYPKKPCYIRNVGCGEVSIANILIEMEQYKGYTPATIQPYCKQFGAPSCDGTYHSAVPTMMKHYGLTDVKEHANMASLWKELAKGDRIAVFLMGSRKAGSKKVKWTSSGHFVCSVGYKVQNGKHYVYVKDSYSNSSLRNKWITYEENMKNDVYKVWSGKLNSTKATAASQTVVTKTSTTTTLTVDGIGGKATIKATQKYFGTTQDGVLSGQIKKLNKYYPSITAVEYGKNGSACVKALQKWLGLTRDGIIGQGTTAAWQKKLRDLGYLASNEKIDGYFGVKSMKAWQKFLNNGGKDLTKKTDTNNASGNTSGGTSNSTSGKTTDYKVIDISYVQRSVDFAKVAKSGIKGVIARCGYRGYEKGGLNEDSTFKSHITKASKAGLAIGAYFFTEAITEKEGREEADFAINLIEKYGIPMSYPIAVDTEAQSAKTERAKNLSKAKRTAAIKGFCERCKERGYEPMIYASTNWLNTKLDMSKLPYKVWVAQYNDKVTYKGSYVMWQYSSKGSVSGISGNVDMNHCYIEASLNAPTPNVEAKKSYSGTYPSTKLVKTNARVIADTIRWAKWIAGDNRFHYGYTNKHGSSDSSKWNPNAHHNGCYFCGTNVASGGRSKKGILDYKFTYCCNPFVGAAWAHGGCVPAALTLCLKGSSWDYHKGAGYDKSSLFTKLGHPAKSKLKAGDVLCRDTHVALYIGDGKIAEASGGDDNKRNSSKWNNSIRIKTLTDANYEKFTRVYRFNSSVNTVAVIRHGEVSERVKLLQAYLDWYFDGKVGSADGIYGDNTLKWVKQFQEEVIGKGQGDGLVGDKTIEAMKKAVK